MKRTYETPKVTTFAIEPLTPLFSSSQTTVSIRNSSYSDDDLTDLSKEEHSWSDIWEDDWSKQ